MIRDSQTKSMVTGAVSYMTSDALIASFYGVSEKDVAAIRRQRPQPRPMMQHQPVDDSSVSADEARERDLAQRCESHYNRIMDYYEKKAARLNCTVAEYGSMAMRWGVSKEGLARARAVIASLPPTPKK